jgi:hypothetical protein
MIYSLIGSGCVLGIIMVKAYENPRPSCNSLLSCQERECVGHDGTKTVDEDGTEEEACKAFLYFVACVPDIQK